MVTFGLFFRTSIIYMGDRILVSMMEGGINHTLHKIYLLRWIVVEYLLRLVLVMFLFRIVEIYTLLMHKMYILSTIFVFRKFGL